MRMYAPPHPCLVLAESFDENFTVADAALKKHHLDPSFMDGFLAVQQGLKP